MLVSHLFFQMDRLPWFEPSVVLVIAAVKIGRWGMYLHGAYHGKRCLQEKKKKRIFQSPMTRFPVVSTIEAHILQFDHAPLPPILLEG